MIKIKKFFTAITLIILLSNCGFTPIFSKKNVNFSIENIEFLGDRDIKEKVNNVLSGYKNKEDKEKKVSLILQGSKSLIVASKDSKGEAQTYKVSVLVNMKVILLLVYIIHFLFLW